MNGRGSGPRAGKNRRRWGTARPRDPTAHRSAAFMPLRTTEPSMPSCPGYRPRARKDATERAKTWTNVWPRGLLEIEVARRLLFEPEAVVLGSVLEELGRVAEEVFVLVFLVVVVVEVQVVVVEFDLVVIVDLHLLLVLLEL